MSSDSVIYKESQQLRQLWLIVIIMLTNAFTLYAFYVQIIQGESFGNSPAGSVVMYFVLPFMLIFNVFLFSVRLSTIVTRDAIRLKFFPIQLKYQIFKWADISEAYITKYRPIGDYGGWGIRDVYKDKAYSISGNIGLQLVLFDGNKIIVGTKKPNLIIQFLKELKEYHYHITIKTNIHENN